MEKNKKLHFKSYEEAAEWFDVHDMSSFEDQMRPVDFHFDLRKNRNWIELDHEIAKYVRWLAKEQNIPARGLRILFLRKVSDKSVVFLTVGPHDKSYAMH